MRSPREGICSKKSREESGVGRRESREHQPQALENKRRLQWEETRKEQERWKKDSGRRRKPLASDHAVLITATLQII